MTAIELMNKQLHNTHIKFAVNGEIFSGVVADQLSHTSGKSTESDYTFIPTSNMIEWKKAEMVNDKKKMDSLSGIVNIEQITWAVRV